MNSSDTPQYIAIDKIADETSFVKTFYFSYELKSKPGQFVMLWIPGLDQKPFSVGYDDGKKFGLTIFNRGATTKKLFEMKRGDRVGISGPYGTSFSVKPNTHYLMVAGGYGAAPLGFLAEEVAKIGSTVDFCAGARNAENLLFEKRIEKLHGIKMHIATDDGSKGHKGFVTDLLPALIDSAKGKVILASCGPEIMQKKVLDLSNQKNVECEVSIERYMKCGVGVCGQCCVDPLGIRMCKEGPVVKKDLANKIIEFGKYYRDKSGAVAKF